MARKGNRRGRNDGVFSGYCYPKRICQFTTRRGTNEESIEEGETWRVIRKEAVKRWHGNCWWPKSRRRVQGCCWVYDRACSGLKQASMQTTRQIGVIFHAVCRLPPTAYRGTGAVMLLPFWPQEWCVRQRPHSQVVCTLDRSTRYANQLTHGERAKQQRSNNKSTQRQQGEEGEEVSVDEGV